MLNKNNICFILVGLRVEGKSYHEHSRKISAFPQYRPQVIYRDVHVTLYGENLCAKWAEYQLLY